MFHHMNLLPHPAAYPWRRRKFCGLMQGGWCCQGGLQGRKQCAFSRPGSCSTCAGHHFHDGRTLERACRGCGAGDRGRSRGSTEHMHAEMHVRPFKLDEGQGHAENMNGVWFRLGSFTPTWNRSAFLSAPFCTFAGSIMHLRCSWERKMYHQSFLSACTSLATLSCASPYSMRVLSA